MINERRSLTVLFYPENKLKIFSGATAHQLLKEGDFKEIKTKTKELKGQPASLGKASERAVVVLDSTSAIKIMTAGDILVAPYTTVEYLPAMKKAGAIVTETGGITSHAAIVSREFKIPCIIGVNDVTKILKTGDRIVVDADSGTIKMV